MALCTINDIRGHRISLLEHYYTNDNFRKNNTVRVGILLTCVKQLHDRITISGGLGR